MSAASLVPDFCATPRTAVCTACIPNLRDVHRFRQCLPPPSTKDKGSCSCGSHLQSSCPACSYHTDPSGTFVQYEAKAIGSGSEGAQTALQEGYRKDMTLKEAEVRQRGVGVRPEHVWPLADMITSAVKGSVCTAWACLLLACSVCCSDSGLASCKTGPPRGGPECCRCSHCRLLPADSCTDHTKAGHGGKGGPTFALAAVCWQAKEGESS